MSDYMKERHSQIAVACGLWIAVIFTSLACIWRPIELVEFDWLTVLTAPRITDSPILIVRIDEASFAELGLQWPWPRSLHGQLVERLAEAGVAVIAFDVEFAEPSTPDSDHRFAEAIRTAGNVVLAAHWEFRETAYVSQWTRVDPFNAFLEAGATAGLTGFHLDPDAILRQVPTHAKCFWREVLKVYGWENTVVLDSVSSRSRIRYFEPNSFPAVSYYQALDPKTLLSPERFKNRIVLIGLDVGASPTPERQQVDMLATPLLRMSGQLTPGLEVHANIIEAALRDRLVTEAPLWSRVFLLLTVAALSPGVLSRWRQIHSAVLAVGLTGGLVLLSVISFVVFNLWSPIAALVIGLWLSYIGQGVVAFRRGQVRERFIRGAFTRYVSSDVVDYMLANPERLVLGGERREVTFIFTDIAGFTALSEELDAETLVELVKGYFEGMGRIILAHHGTIERFAGDGLVAMFNAPMDQPDHAALAVTCALELDTFTQEFAAEQRAHGVPLGITRIGGNTGEVTVGNFGSNKRFHYTAMGDPINTASRLEGANKYLGTRVCFGGATAARCPGIAFRSIGDIFLKGKGQAIEVFEPLREEAAVKPDTAAYQAAYELLRAGDPKAAKAFETVLAHNPDDPLAAFHVSRLRAGETGIKIRLADK